MWVESSRAVFYHEAMKFTLRAVLPLTLSCLLLTQCVGTPGEGQPAGDRDSEDATVEQFLQHSLEEALEHPLEEPLKKPARKALAQASEPRREKPARPTAREATKKDSEQAAGETYTAAVRLGMVTILDGTRRVATCRTAAPHVEETRFINGQKQIVVKSRARHGPAVVQLFDTRTGAERDAVMANEIGNGQPAWAAGVED